MNDITHIALARIKHAADKQATELDLSNLQLTYLPTEIAQCRKLRSLNLSQNALSTLPPQIGMLTELQELFVDYNQIAILPQEIGNLGKIRLLSLNNNRLTNISRGLRQLIKIEHLDLSNNRLFQIPAYLDDNFAKIQSLRITHNQIAKLNDHIGKLKTLTELDISGNQIKILPAFLGNLKQLQTLNAANNQIHYIDQEVGLLAELRHIDLSNNLLAGLPRTFSKLTFFVEQTTPTNTQQHKPNGIFLKGNNLQIPEEMYQQKPNELVRYILDLQRSRNSRPLREAKLIVVGAGDVGKTSLINVLTTGIYDPAQLKTDGVDIRSWYMYRGKDKIKLNIWDFGGQEIMHATHKFFMTSRSVYMLVVNPRTEDTHGDSELEYWIKLIRSYADQVPIVVVLNKCDIHRLELPKVELLDKYPNIVAFVETSCVQQTGIAPLRDALANAILRLRHLDDLLPQSYFKIKQQLERINDDYISYEQYKQLCVKIDPDFSAQSMQTLMALLNDLGVMLTFTEEYANLHEMQVLNPEWVTRGVYQIIASPMLARRKGVLNTRDIARILDPQQYKSAKERFYIMDLMRRFDLCYQIPGEMDMYFVPGAFPKDRPASFAWRTATGEVLRLQYRYDILPGSVMSHFIAKVHDFIHEQEYWRNGVVIANKQARAFVKADLDDRTIYMEVSGSKQQRQEMLSFVRAQLDVINKRLSKLRVSIQIPLDETGKVCIDYENVLFYIENGLSELPVKELGRSINLRELLEGYPIPETSNKNAQQISKMTTDPAANTSETLVPQKWYEQLWIKLFGLLTLLAMLAEIYQAFWKR